MMKYYLFICLFFFLFSLLLIRILYVMKVDYCLDRYLVAVNIIGFVYAGFQACDLAYHLVSGKHVISSSLRYFFDFAMDQASDS